jgi:hypothetical protein
MNVLFFGYYSALLKSYFMGDIRPPCASPALFGGGGACDASELPVRDKIGIIVKR